MRKSRSRSRSKSRSRKAGEKKVTIKVETKSKARPVLRRGRGRGKGSFGLTVSGRRLAPVARAASFHQRGPKLNGGKTFRVCHKELIMTVASVNTNFSFYRYQIQPGVPLTFPWLAQIATAYKEWQLRKIIFRYEPNCATSLSGAMLIVPLYDPSEASPGSVEQILDMKNAVSFPVWQAKSVSFSGQKNQKNLFVRTLSVTDPVQFKFYDFGAVVLALDGVEPNANLGKFMVEYEVDFFVPYKTNGEPGGFGSILTSNPLAEPDTTSCFSGCTYFQGVGTPDDPTKDHVWYPPSSFTNPYIQYGLSDVTPLFTQPNTIKWAQPGFYFATMAWFNVDAATWSLNSITTAGCTAGVTVSTTTVPTVNLVHIVLLYVRVALPGATLQLNWTGGGPYGFGQLIVNNYTVPNGIHNFQGGFFGSVPCIYAEHDYAEMQRKGCFQGLNLDNVYSLNDEQMRLFKADGVLPRKAKQPTIQSLQQQLSQILERIKPEDLKKGDMLSNLSGDLLPLRELSLADRKLPAVTLDEGSDDDFKVLTVESPREFRDVSLPPIPVVAQAAPVITLGGVKPIKPVIKGK